ncbi:hypothetical protein D6C13_19720 [Rahnella woolbedingensis]|uniref:Uncharacterized protein n=1 Tax=Rahnella woolbedingensis TaxID=1510574 RepID=A0A419N4E1_9GAMM|nr:hypothetical protein D6C13_19720 [Rahnella woolbedingensis]
MPCIAGHYAAIRKFIGALPPIDVLVTDASDDTQITDIAVRPRRDKVDGKRSALFMRPEESCGAGY